MTSKDIFMSRVMNDPSGPLPIFLRDLTLGLDVIDARTTDVFTSAYDHELSAKGVVAFQRLTGQDAVVGCIHSAAFNVESFGGVMKYSEYGIPNVAEHPFEALQDVPKDVDLEPKGRTLGAIRSYSIVRKELPDVAVVANVEGPLTKAGVLTGMTNLALRIATDRSYVNDIIKLSMAHTKVFLEKLHEEASIDCVFLASATDNPDLFGPGIYSELTLPWLRDLVRHCHYLGYPVIFHPHGTFTSLEGESLLRDTVETGIDGFQFAENNDPARIKTIIDGRCSILGGTDVVPTLISGTDEEIRSETRRYVNACTGASHVFMCSCSLHRKTDLDNIQLMVETARRCDPQRSGSMV